MLKILERSNSQGLQHFLFLRRTELKKEELKAKLREAEQNDPVNFGKLKLEQEELQKQEDEFKRKEEELKKKEKVRQDLCSKMMIFKFYKILLDLKFFS